MVYCDLWWWFIVNYDDGLLCLWHIIMPVMMVYCELRGVRYTWQISKKGGLGRFAECNTRQRDALPSVKPKHSAKRSISIILRTFFAECFVFAECILMDTQQSNHKICPLCSFLPSVLVLTLGKVCKRCWVLWSWHSANFRNLPSVLELTLGKLCRVFFRRALGKIAVTVPSR